MGLERFLAGAMIAGALSGVAAYAQQAFSRPRPPRVSAGYALMQTLPAPTPKREIVLTWNANDPAQNVTGYTLHHGRTSGFYKTESSVLERIPVGNVTSYTMTDQAQGLHCFVLTAKNATGESGYSNEACGTIVAVNRCDVNGDGALNGTDTRITAEAGVGTAACPGYCDTNRDGRVDAADVQLVTNAIFNVSSCPK